MTRAQLDKRPADVAAMFDDVARRYDLTNDILSLGVVQQNIGRRPVVWAITAGRSYGGLGPECRRLIPRYASSVS